VGNLDSKKAIEFVSTAKAPHSDDKDT